MKISIIGAGYVGLVSGVCLAEKGHHVVCVDTSLERVAAINDGQAPFYESGLDDLLKKNVPEYLSATTDFEAAVTNSEITIIAVGTPFDGKSIDLGQVATASSQIGRVLKNKSEYHTVIVKSTVVPGTTDDVVIPLLEKASGKIRGKDFGAGMNPEFLREGEAVADFMFPDRIVLGGVDERTIDILDDMYSSFPTVDRLKTNNKTAEMIKYASNSLMATAISFSNEIGNLCASLGGVDAIDVMKGVHLDKRLSPFMPNGERILPSFLTYLEAGCGFGGSCFPKDVMALSAYGTKMGSPMKILQAVLEVNKEQPSKVLSLVEKHFIDLKEVSVAVLGLAFKPGTDDLRETPALPVINELLARGAKVRAFDPIAGEKARKLFPHPDCEIYDSLTDVLDGDVKVIILMTRWEEFSQVPQLLLDKNVQPVVIDGRRMLDKGSTAKYEGIGL